MNFREMTQEQLREESLIDIAYAILEDRKSAINFNDLLKEIQSYNGMTDEELKSRLVQFYTDLNVEGRFLLNQDNGWGLREWYKVETIEEETAPTVKARKKKKAVTDEEDEELIDLDEEDVVFEEDYDEFAEEDEEDAEEVVEDLELLTDDIEDLDEDIEEELIEEDEEFELEEDELEEER